MKVLVTTTLRQGERKTDFNTFTLADNHHAVVVFPLRQVLGAYADDDSGEARQLVSLSGPRNVTTTARVVVVALSFAGFTAAMENFVRRELGDAADMVNVRKRALDLATAYSHALEPFSVGTVVEYRDYRLGARV